MVLFSENPLLNLDTESVHLIDTQNTGNLHAFWSVCSRCARTDTLQNAKRLENLSWRIYSQQTLSRSPERFAQSYSVSRRDFSSESIPDLSRSPGSPISSDDEMSTPPDTKSNMDISHMGSLENPKTISSVELETIVRSVSENKELQPLSPLPVSICPPTTQTLQPTQSEPPKHVAEPQADHERVIESYPRNRDVESSTSTMATTAVDSAFFDHLNTADSSTSTEVSSMSIVRGFSKDQISFSRRSRTQLAPPPILKQASPSPQLSHPIIAKKKQTTFMVGASPDDDNSSYDSPRQQSSLTHRLQDFSGSSGLHGSYNHSESAIDDDEDEEEEDGDGDWEDDNEGSQQEDLFARVASTTDLRSRPSLLTVQIHEQDRSSALQNAASRSTPAIRRSRTSSHNGPIGASPQREQTQLSRARPIITTESQPTNSMPIALSPRTNRRNMLSTELTGSLRKHLLWERQQRFPATKTLKNRQFRSEIRLTDHQADPQLSTEEPLRRNDTANFYDNGLQEYFEKGW
ncbi:DUF1752-domain-containing protein [Microthyrium microscopicum]|uniref:DUF1752-domain-containing protein n=1 Tax=Microthyrium microscopicum TaxID=703497 RepID=A0A6A6UIE0_9PEZI|nr:DUF1752-domain-containing protein [Microthyrium microscopicum]